MTPWLLAACTEEAIAVVETYKIEGRVTDIRFVDIPSKVKGGAP